MARSLVVRGRFPVESQVSTGQLGRKALTQTAVRRWIGVTHPFTQPWQALPHPLLPHARRHSSGDSRSRACSRHPSECPFRTRHTGCSRTTPSKQCLSNCGFTRRTPSPGNSPQSAIRIAQAPDPPPLTQRSDRGDPESSRGRSRSSGSANGWLRRPAARPPSVRLLTFPIMLRLPRRNEWSAVGRRGVA
jgi:hypothetical protein